MSSNRMQEWQPIVLKQTEPVSSTYLPKWKLGVCEYLFVIWDKTKKKTCSPRKKIRSRMISGSYTFWTSQVDCITRILGNSINLFYNNSPSRSVCFSCDPSRIYLSTLPLVTVLTIHPLLRFIGWVWEQKANCHRQGLIFQAAFQTAHHSFNPHIMISAHTSWYKLSSALPV